MDLVRDLLIVVHVAGFAALLLGLLLQLRRPQKVVNGLMRDGAGTAFLTGLLLVAAVESDDGDVDHAKIAVKGLVGLVVLVLVMANLRKERISTGLWALVLLLTVANVAVALLWT